MQKNYRHLSINERYTIKELKVKGKTLEEIGVVIGRSKSSISSEINRNKKNGDYMPCVAQRKYEQRLHKEDGLKIEKNITLQKYIIQAMTVDYWSPNAISGRLQLDANLPDISKVYINSSTNHP